MAEFTTYNIADVVIFVVFLLASTIIPLWSGIFGKKKDKSKADYVFATGSVSMLAMMMSIARGTLGVRVFLGFPSELFYRGAAMWETLYGMVNAYPIVCFIFIPVYYSLGITSVYQYLDMRFKSRLVRCLASGTFILRQLTSLGVTLYTPCVALNALTGIPDWASLLGMTVICIIFTVMGGLKAAITADVIQGLIMIAVSVLVIIQGTWEAGGIDKAYKANRDNGRLEFFNVGDITTRVDTVSAWLGQLFMSLSIFGCQQNFVQRYVSMGSIKDVYKTMMANIPLVIVLFSLSWLCGMGIFATYLNCDPLEAGYIQKIDEILPFFVQDKLAYIPGLMGLFMATLFNGALTLNVSNLNSLATVTWEDFLCFLPAFKGKTDKQQLHLIKYLGALYGVLVMGVAFSVGLLSGVIESFMLTSSATSGPLLGAFLLAMLVPCANWKGTAFGMIAAHISTLWIMFGSFAIDKAPSKYLETSTAGCNNFTFAPGLQKLDQSWLVSNTPLEIVWDSQNHSHIATTSMPETESGALIYRMSYMYYSLFGTLLTVLLGIIVSMITASKDDEYSPRLLHPLVYKISMWLPGSKPYYKTESSTTHNGAVNSAFEMQSESTTPKPPTDNLQDAHFDNGDVNGITVLGTEHIDVDESDVDRGTNSTSIKYRPQPVESYRRFESDCV